MTPNEEKDGIGLLSALMVMTKLKGHLDFLDDEQASELVERFARKKKGKTVAVKGINFLQTSQNKGILNSLQNFPLFENDSDLVRVSNIMVTTLIAHKFRAEYLWQRYLNLIVPKKILQ